MSEVRITKKDIYWSYAAQFFNIGAGLITLPIILNRLNEDEIGLNYLMITISSMIALLDFGFTPQFSRNITYVFAGSPSIQKVGIAKSVGTINYSLLSNMISVAKKVYAILAIVSVFLMLSVGTVYINKVTSGFSTVDHSLLIWIIYSLSIFFNIYYIYLSSLLTGRGQIMESKKAMMAQKITYIILTYILVLSGWGLMGVVIANLLSPFVGRFLSYRMFYDAELKEELKGINPDTKAEKAIFITIWYNAKKLGLAFIGAYAINKLAIFLAGLFLSLADIASYGLLVQLTTILMGVAITFNTTSQPLFSSLRTESNNNELIKRFSVSLIIYYAIFIAGSLFLIFLAPAILKIIGSNTTLPSRLIVFLYSLVILLEGNHSIFANLITTGNRIPFVEANLLTGMAIGVLSFIELKYSTFGLLGLILVQGICECLYSNWKWPCMVCREFDISYIKLIKIGLRDIFQKKNKLYNIA